VSYRFLQPPRHRTLMPKPIRLDRSLRPLFLSLLPGSQKRLQQLKKTRENLSVELSDIISKCSVRVEVGAAVTQSAICRRIRPAAVRKFLRREIRPTCSCQSGADIQL
jgi:hypothetical protein